MSARAEPPGRNATEGFPHLWKVVGQVAAPTTLATSLMVYFGWARTTVIYEVFGINSSVLDLTLQDYLFRSVGTTFRPLAFVLLVLLLLRPTHHALLRWQDRSASGRLLPTVFFAVGYLLLVVGLLGFLRLVAYQVEWPLVPLSLGLSVLLIGYAGALRAIRVTSRSTTAGDPEDDSDNPRSDRPEETDHLQILQRVSLAAVVVVTLFWSAAVFAQLDGARTAERIAANPRSLPGVVVFAPRRLHLYGTGVVETTLPSDPDPMFRYRYDGYRLLIRSNKRHFLLPEQWRPGTRAVVLADEPSIRIEYYR